MGREPCHLGGYASVVGAKELVHRSLVRTYPVAEVPGLGRAWRKARNVSERRWGSEWVEAELHGSRATINFANPYPYWLRRFPNRNAPQVELVAVSAEALGRRVSVVDVGAAIGDTALLMLQHCDAAIARLECIEGEPAFAELLRQNLRDPRCHVREVVLSDRPGEVAGLIRDQHQGTASARGDVSAVAASTLDLELAGSSPDVLKIDTEGFDGNILAGGRDLLRRARPAVLFEWHPPLSRAVGTDSQLAFEVLREQGYDRWVFFTKYGQFSHFAAACLDQLERLCLESHTLPDWHYNVVALHSASAIDEVGLADLRHWGRSGYP